MNHIEIITKLKSNSPDCRYEAAKILAGQQNSLFEEYLNIAFEKETVGYIKTTLGLAIKRLKSVTTSMVELEYIDETYNQNSYLDGMNEMASIFLHELEPVVGRISYTAKKEIEDFDKSEISKHIGKLRSIIQAITELRQVNKSKNTMEINFWNYIDEIIQAEFSNEVGSITLSGNKSTNSICDVNLLGLAIINGIRNSLESCFGCEKKPKIVIRWGETNVDWYICIVDNGTGINISVDELKKRNVTTKNNHLGYGLLIINNAMERVDGHWTLENDVAEGANLTLRWNK